jgi:GntR family transcriptional regulator, uxu operon transcriptional repressor
MPIQVVDSDRLYKKIARQLSELIASGEFAPGQRLPAERELAQQLGVSRPSVREALIALEIEGKVEIRVGAGVFVSEPRRVELSAAQEGEGPFELIRARRVVEGETAAWAARDATDAEVAEIRAAFDEMRRLHGASRSADPADRAFHVAVARATHNGPLLAVVEMLWDQGRGAVWKQMEKHFETPALRAATVRDHKAILDAIAGHDAADARRAMRDHLARVDREFTHGWKMKRRRAGDAAREAKPGGEGGATPEH